MVLCTGQQVTCGVFFGWEDCFYHCFLPHNELEILRKMELFSVSPIIIIAAACGWAGVWGRCCSHSYLLFMQTTGVWSPVQYSTVQYSTVQYSTTYIESIDLLDQGLFLVGSRWWLGRAETLKLIQLRSVQFNLHLYFESKSKFKVVTIIPAV